MDNGIFGSSFNGKKMRFLINVSEFIFLPFSSYLKSGINDIFVFFNIIHSLLSPVNNYIYSSTNC